MAPAGYQNHDTQVMNNNIHNGLYQITIIPCKNELDVLPSSKAPLALVQLGLRKIAKPTKTSRCFAYLFILHRLVGHGAQSEFI